MIDIMMGMLCLQYAPRVSTVTVVLSGVTVLITLRVTLIVEFVDARQAGLENAVINVCTL